MRSNIVFKLPVLLLLTFLHVVTFAQIGKPYEMTIQGVKVIVQPSGNEIVNIVTVLKGGVVNYPANKQGIESLAIRALTECGTEKDDKNSFKNKLDKVSAIMSGGSGLDYSYLTLNCIKGDFETVWPLYIDALTVPKFDDTEFERVKQDAINTLKEAASDPEHSIDNFARQTAFAGKNYAKLPEGTEPIVSKLTSTETKAYYKKILTRSRMLIVVVGEIDRDDLEKKVSGLLAAIPAGAPFKMKQEAYIPGANTFKAEKKAFATNYLQGVGGAPVPGAKDYNAYLLAMHIFSDRHFLEVRTNNGLSYAPGSYLNAGLSPVSIVSVSTTDPNKYIGVVEKLISNTKKEGFKEEEVKDMKSTYTTNYYYRLETNAAQATALVLNELLQNNWRRAITLSEDIKSITAADVSKAFNKYFANLTWAYQGDPEKVNSKLYTKQTGVKTMLSPSKVSDNKNK